ncbi:MAG: hypothetical protein AAF500_12805 [Myxococcota bacterium]
MTSQGPTFSHSLVVAGMRQKLETTAYVAAFVLAFALVFKLFV